jgi:RHS repeat-associated protein
MKAGIYLQALAVVFWVGALYAQVTNQNSYLRIQVTPSASVLTSNQEVSYNIVVTNISNTVLNDLFISHFTEPVQTFLSSTPTPTDVNSGTWGTEPNWQFPSLAPSAQLEIITRWRTNDLSGQSSVFNSFFVFATGVPDLTTTLSIPISTAGPQLDKLVKYNDGGFEDKETAYHFKAISQDKSHYLVVPPGWDPSNSTCKPCPSYLPGSCGIIPGSCSGKCVSIDPQAGDPVTLNNLEFTCSAVDLEIAGRGGLNYRFERHYRSRITLNASLGRNWTSPYLDMRLVPHPTEANQVIFHDGKGRQDIYYVLSDGTFLPPNFHFKGLFKQSDNTLILREPNHLRFVFFPLDNTPQAGKFSAIINKCNNRMTFQYNAQGQMVTVLDSLSRPIEHHYDATTGRLIKIRDFTSREVLFSYNSEGQLIAVRSPVATGTPNGNDFPNGKTYRYTYSTGSADEKLNGNMLTITAPNEVAVNGSPYIVNIYNAADELISQQWGGTNASGVAAGGTITYSRQVVNIGVDPNNPDPPREVVTIIDRNGNEKIFSFNNTKNMVRKEEKTRGVRPGDPASYITTLKYTATGLLKEQTMPQGNKIVYEWDEANADRFQNGNLLSVTRLPDSQRGGDQPFLKVNYSYESMFNQILKIVEERGNDPTFVPQNGGVTSPQRYTTEYIVDYMEGGLDTQGCDCGHTLREEANKYHIDLTRILAQLNQGDLNGDGKFAICGNTVLIRFPKVNLRPSSPQIAREGGIIQTIEVRIVHNRYGQKEREETPEGEVAEYFYFPESDPDGDGQDLRTGNNNAGKPFDNLTGGYLKKVIVDNSHSVRYRGTVAPTKLSVEMGYTAVGNVRFVIDARGVRSDFTTNQLNQRVEIIHASDVSNSTEPGLAAFGYKQRFYFDFNNNQVKTELEYRDGNNPNLPQFIETTAKFDILNNVIETTRKVSTNETITTQMRYDANENPREVISPLAVAGSQPNNRIKMIYDERDLLFQTISAPGTPEEAITTGKRDLNGNKIEHRDAENNSGNVAGDVTSYFLDGYNRIRRIVDAVGNELVRKFDPASNIIEVQVLGQIGGVSRATNSTAGNVLMAQSTMSYDELSRMFQSNAELFVSAGIFTQRGVVLNDGDLTPGDGKVTSFSDYDRNSRVTFLTLASPSNAVEMIQKFYDGASREFRSIDQEQNEVLVEFDANSNPIRVTVIEKSPSSRVAPKTFVTINVFDALNRRTRTTDNLGQTRRFFWDSRDLLIKTTDAQGGTTPDPLGLYQGNINADGNVLEMIQDGLGRTLETRKYLRVAGQGGNPLDTSNSSNPDGKIIETTLWDKNSRRTEVSDDKKNKTQYLYDNRNRPITTTFADGTVNQYVWDKDNNLRQFVDNSNNVVTHTFDAINRLVRRSIVRSTTNNVKGTTAQTFEFDGLSRITKATDNNDPLNLEDDSIVERKYDSLSRLLEELQNGKVISLNWREDDDLLDLTYPNNRKITYTRDKLDRLKTIASNGTFTPLASYDYIGYRLLERKYGNNTRLTMLNDAGNVDIGYDGLPRVVEMRHLKNGNTLLAGYKFGYNRENMKVYEENLAQTTLSEIYQYDSVYRVVDFKRGTLNTTKDGVVGTALSTQTWNLDGVGNWAVTTVDSQPKTQTVNEMNEYDSFGGTSQVHDPNGNLTDDGSLKIAYDFTNRIVEVSSKQDNKLIAQYGYDAFNQRFFKKIFTEVEVSQGEYQPDSNTLALYHFNETTGQVVDSSGNANHGKAPQHIFRGISGLFGTNAVEFKGAPIIVKNSPSLSNIKDKLTVESWVYLPSVKCEDKKHKPQWKLCCVCKKKHHHKDHHTPLCWFCPLCFDKSFKRGSLILRPGSYELEIKQDRKASFILFVQTLHEHKQQKDKEEDDKDDDKEFEERHECHKFSKHVRKIRIKANENLPVNQWVHLAAVYDGAKVSLFVNGVKQREEKQASGEVRKVSTPLFLGGEGFRGRMEEARISNVARTQFGGSGVVTQVTLRNYFYAGWQILEERERKGVLGQALGQERVTRQFVDGTGIDEHLTQDVYNATGTAIEKTLYYHENARGDTVAISDGSGSVVVRIEYSAYGEAYQVNAQGGLEALQDEDMVFYTFQGRQLDGETGLLYFRNRYYDPKQGRFLQRDPIGSADGMGLYEAFGGKPINNSDPLGLTTGVEESVAIGIVVGKEAAVKVPAPFPTKIVVGISVAIAVTGGYIIYKYFIEPPCEEDEKKKEKKRYFYHATSLSYAEDILAQGIQPKGEEQGRFFAWNRYDDITRQFMQEQASEKYPKEKLAIIRIKISEENFQKLKEQGLAKEGPTGRVEFIPKGNPPDFAALNSVIEEITIIEEFEAISWVEKADVPVWPENKESYPLLYPIVAGYV